jgi:hypothetical protein
MVPDQCTYSTIFFKPLLKRDQVKPQNINILATKLHMLFLLEISWKIIKPKTKVHEV